MHECKTERKNQSLMFSFLFQEKGCKNNILCSYSFTFLFLSPFQPITNLLNTHTLHWNYHSNCSLQTCSNSVTLSPFHSNIQRGQTNLIPLNWTREKSVLITITFPYISPLSLPHLSSPYPPNSAIVLLKTTPVWRGNRDGRFCSKLGHIGPKCDKSGAFSDQISVHLAPRANLTHFGAKPTIPVDK